MVTRNSPVTLDLADCPCGGGTLDRLIQPAILTALAQEPMHGYRIAEQIAKIGIFRDTKPDGSGIYRFLKTMQSRGLVVASWTTSEHGPAKKSYRITPAGQRCLEHWIATLQAYRDGIDTLLTAARQAAES